MKRSRGPVWALILLALVLILLGILGEDWKSLLKFAGASTLLVLLALAFIWIWSGESRPQPPVRRRAGTDARSFHTRVVGVTFTNPDGAQRQGIIYECQVGEELLLIREPGNRFDPNAIKVCRASGEQFGHISSDVAVRMAGEMDGGKEFHAFISELTGGTRSKPTRGVNIEIYVR
jgi:hypothetical protein